jgi:hypothetical protein
MNPTSVYICFLRSEYAKRDFIAETSLKHDNFLFLFSPQLED